MSPQWLATALSFALAFIVFLILVFLDAILGLVGFAKSCHETSAAGVTRWTDCGCHSCVSWLDAHNLHLVLRQPSSPAINGNCRGQAAKNVIFLHGFLSSSSFWTETVFPKISEPVSRHYRLFAVDLLGFDLGPKPRDCLYTLKDHLEMIEKSVICPFQLTSFHLVAHHGLSDCNRFSC